MPGLLDLPPELHMIIVRYLSGTPSMTASAMICRTTSEIVKDVRDNDKVMNLRTGTVATIHRGIAWLASQANNGTIAPPNVDIQSGG
jgi:hypothetical protein